MESTLSNLSIGNRILLQKNLVFHEVVSSDIAFLLMLAASTYTSVFFSAVVLWSGHL